MTIKLSESSFGDRILNLIGKKRAIRIPLEVYDKFGPYVYAKAQKESFWRALIRPEGKLPPNGWTYPFDHK